MCNGQARRHEAFVDNGRGGLRSRSYTFAADLSLDYVRPCNQLCNSAVGATLISIWYGRCESLREDVAATCAGPADMHGRWTRCVLDATSIASTATAMSATRPTG